MNQQRQTHEWHVSWTQQHEVHHYRSIMTLCFTLLIPTYIRRQFIKFSAIFIVIFSLTFPQLVLSLDSDRLQPANILADYVTIDSHAGVGTYVGHVHITQGSTKLDADKLITYFDKNRKLTKAIATGNPAHYETIPQPGDKLMQATANHIEYYPQAGYVMLIGAAQIIQNDNSLKADKLKYDYKKGFVHTMRRTQIILQPNSQKHLQ